MTATALRLTDTYRRELDAYERILELARQGAACVREGKPLADLHRLNLEKRRWLKRVEALEATMAQDKARWRSEGGTGRGSGELDALLAKLVDLIEEILHWERQTDRWIVEGGFAPQSAAATEHASDDSASEPAGRKTP